MTAQLPAADWDHPVFAEGAVQGRAADVRMRRDEARGHDAVGGVYRLVHGAVEPRSHLEDAVALEHDHAVAQEAMAVPVEGDDPAGPAWQCVAVRP